MAGMYRTSGLVALTFQVVIVQFVNANLVGNLLLEQFEIQPTRADMIA